VVAAPLVVVAGLKDPHDASPQATVHFTCGLADVSFLITAFHDTAAFTCKDAGIVGWNETEIAMGGTIVMTAEMDLLVSADAVAVMVTVPPEGIVEGAVYTIAPSSSLAFDVPHAFALPHVIE
jgi:hypothetical protein